jgi:O-antigen ligase
LTLAALFGLACYGLDVQPGESVLRTCSSVGGQGRVPGSLRSAAGGFYFHRLKMAHVLLLGLSVLWARQLVLPLRFWRRCGELGLLAVACACLALTFARGAALGAAAAAAVGVYLAPRRARFAVLAAVVLACCAAAQVPGVRARLMSGGQGQAASIRGLIWSQAVQIMADHPWGVGLGNYTAVVGRYYDQVDPSFATRTYPHNVLLSAWAETGPLGLMGWAMLWLAFARACIGACRPGSASRAPPEIRAAAAAGLCMCAAFWTVGLTHDVLYHNVVAQAYVATMAWVYVSLTPKYGTL